MGTAPVLEQRDSRMSSPARPILRSSILAGGSGTPVLLLHGSASAAVMWTPIIDALKPRVRVIAPDLIGYGRTESWPDGHDFTAADELRLLEPLLPPGRPVHVVAHSYGGLVALHLALAGRVALRSLTLIEPVAFFLLRHAGAHDAWTEIKAVGDCYAENIARKETEAALRGFIDYWAGEGAWDAMDETLRAQIRRSAEKIVLDFEVAFTDVASQVLSSLRALKCPVRLISGGRSRLPTRRIISILAAEVPAATLDVIDDANHLLPVTHGDVLSALLMRELDA
jgi:pimeloyl-ACP methyl ester carboxylesterase